MTKQLVQQMMEALEEAQKYAHNIGKYLHGVPQAITAAREYLSKDSQESEALVAANEREACAKIVGEFAQKWWSIHCASNKHMETTRKAHDDFCALQVAIRARGTP